MIQNQIFPAALLPKVIQAVAEAGALLRAEFHRPSGPRGHGDKAPVDIEAEEVLKARLLALLACGWRGEETAGRISEDGWLWVVDPHDGTGDFLAGHRGSAVSVALLCQGVPVLGVVHAPLYPDDLGEMIAWAEGLALTRNGKQVTPQRGFAKPVVAVGLKGLAHAPGLRALLLPSPAFRLALAAVGAVDAAISHAAPLWSWDIAGGAALLKGAGKPVVDLRGQPVDFRREGFDGVIGGQADVVAELLLTPMARLPQPARRNFPPVRPVADACQLSRAQGSLLGLFAGDALGSQVEFQTQAQILRRTPDGPRDLVDGGTWTLIAGQPTDDGEMALSLAGALVTKAGFDPQAVAAAYINWRKSGPFDIGTTTSAGIAALQRGQQVVSDSQANGALMRVAPIGIACAGLPMRAAEWATADAELTHPHAVCRAASAGFAAAISVGVAGGGVTEMMQAAQNHASSDAVRACLRAAKDGPPKDFQRNMGWVLLALQNAFAHLQAATPLEEALIATVAAGGDTDTNAAICGALLGASQGREAVPLRWRNAVLTCHPHAAASPVHPRPAQLWPDRALSLAESLLSLAGVQ